MGKALIIKGADFSANKMGTLDETTTTVIGTSESLWSQAITPISAGGTAYGFLCGETGYITKVKVTSTSALTFAIRIYRNGQYIDSSDYSTSNSTRAATEISITPMEVQQGDVIGLLFRSTGAVYKTQGGNIDTYTLTNGGAVKDGNIRIYPWNFTIVSFG